MAASLIAHVRILDGTGGEPFAGEALVEGNRSAAVTPGGAAPRPEGATLIDGAGATPLPELVEPPAHPSVPHTLSLDFRLRPPEPPRGRARPRLPGPALSESRHRPTSGRQP